MTVLEDPPNPPEGGSAPPREGGGDPVPTAESPAARAIPPNPAPTNAALWWEVAAVLAVGIIPNFAVAVSMLGNPHPLRPLPYWLDAFYLSTVSGCVIFVTLYLIGRSGEPWANFGIVRPHAWDVLLGLFLAWVAWMIWFVLPTLPDIGVQSGEAFPRPRGPVDYSLMVIKFVIAAFAEEVVARAYLLTRLKVLLRSSREAVFCAAFLFASFHIYQGLPGAVYSFAFGVVYGIVFLVIGRVWPLAIGHALYNIYLDLLPS